MKGLSLTLLVVAGFALPAQAQTLRNASFEQEDRRHPDKALHWGRWGHWMNRETGWRPVRSGAALTAYHHYRIDGPENSGFWQDVPNAQKGSYYTFTIHANADRADPGKTDAREVEVRLESIREDQILRVNARRYPVRELATGDRWSPLTVGGTAPVPSLRVVVVVYPAAEGPRDGAVKFDDASLMRGSGPGSGPLQPPAEDGRQTGPQGE